MAETEKPVLVATLHDPDNRMEPFLAENMPFLHQIYHGVIIMATRMCSPDITDTLLKMDVHLRREGDENIGKNRLAALRFALELYPDSRRFHYCDFDRTLHWAMYQPDEMQLFTEDNLTSAGYVIVGRTPEALASHPAAQIETEIITNSVVSAFLGRTVDIGSGSCLMTRNVADCILQNSTELTNATDAEWVMLAYCNGFEVLYVEMRGLEFETATFYGPEIYDYANRPENWQQRTHLAGLSVNAALRVQAEYADTDLI